MTRAPSRRAALAALLALATLPAAACVPDDPGGPADHRLLLAAFSASRDLFERELIPAFTADHLARTGERVRIDSSYLASGAQARAVEAGFEADIVVLALAPDIDRLAAAALITHDWRARPHAGIFATTPVAFAVRPGNPQRITSWPDLARPGVSVLMPNPRTSGGAMWNAAALHGAAIRGHAGVPPHDPAAAATYLHRVLRNVAILDKAARESIITFEKGVGDVAITYESEIVAGRLAGRHYDTVIPPSPLLVEIPAATVDAYTTRHGTQALAAAFLDFLQTPAAQRSLARYGFRPVDPTLAPETAPMPADALRIADLGGWPEVQKTLFGKGGLFTRTWESVYSEDP